MKTMRCLGGWLVGLSMAACSVDTAPLDADDPGTSTEDASEAQQALLDMGFDCYDGWGFDYEWMMDEGTFAYAYGDCYADPWGGGGGFGDPIGEGPCEWWPEATYFGSGSSSDASESVARQQAGSQAAAQASAQCYASGRFCTAYVSWTRLDEMDCYRLDDPDTGYVYTCSAKRSAGCLYR